MSSKTDKKPTPKRDFAKILIWVLLIPCSFLFLSDIGLLESLGENWILVVFFGVLALIIAGPLDLGLGLSKLFRNDPDRRWPTKVASLKWLGKFFFSRSFSCGLGSTFLVIMILTVIFFCDRYNLYGTGSDDQTTRQGNVKGVNVRGSFLAPRVIAPVAKSLGIDFPGCRNQGLSDRLDSLRIKNDELNQLMLLPFYLICGSLPLLAIIGLCVLFPTEAADQSLDFEHNAERRKHSIREILGYLAGGLCAFLSQASMYLVALTANKCGIHEYMTNLDTFKTLNNVSIKITRVQAHDFSHLAIFFVIFFVIFSSILRFWRKLSGGLGICLVLNLIVLGFFVIKVITPSLNLPVIGGAIAVMIFFNSWPYKYHYPNMESAYDEPIKLEEMETLIEAGKIEPRGAANLLNDRAVLEAWKQRMSENNGQAGKPPIVLVAVTGGAYRAAFWTTIVLEKLSASFPGFFDHVRLITGASGGMVGAAYAVTMVSDPQTKNHVTDTPTEKLRKETKLNSLTPVITQLVRYDLPLSIRPGLWPQSNDRGRTLEDQWTTLNSTFNDLRKGEEEGWRPSLVISPMVVETGRRLIFSNLDLYGLTDEQARERQGVSADAFDRSPAPTIANGAGRRISRSAVEFFRGFPELKDKFRLKTAVRMNAAFPIVSPAVCLPTDPPRRVVDAGYYDNYGVDLATAWIYHNRAWLYEHTSGVALIQIRAYPSESIRKRVWVEPSSNTKASPINRIFNWLATGMHALTTPIIGVGSARTWSMSYRNDQTIQRLYEHFNTPCGAASAGTSHCTKYPSQVQKPVQAPPKATESPSNEARQPTIRVVPSPVRNCNRPNSSKPSSSKI